MAAGVTLSAGTPRTRYSSGEWTRAAGTDGCISIAAEVSLDWVVTMVSGSNEACRASSCPATAVTTPETDGPFAEEDATPVLNWRRSVERAAVRIDSPARAKTKRWRQRLFFLRNPAAVGDLSLGGFRVSSRLCGPGVRGLSVPLMLFASC